jgi:hypothetical protein
MQNIFNKIITESFPNLEKTMPIQIQEVSRTLSRPDQNRTTPQHIVIKTTSTETIKIIMKAVREKKPNNIQRKTHQNHCGLLNRNIKNKKSLG